MKYPAFPLMLAALAYGGAAVAGNALFEALERDQNDYLTLDETQTNPRGAFAVQPARPKSERSAGSGRITAAECTTFLSDLDIDQSLGIDPEKASASREP